MCRPTPMWKTLPPPRAPFAPGPRGREPQRVAQRRHRRHFRRQVERCGWRPGWAPGGGGDGSVAPSPQDSVAAKAATAEAGSHGRRMAPLRDEQLAVGASCPSMIDGSSPPLAERTGVQSWPLSSSWIPRDASGAPKRDTCEALKCICRTPNRACKKVGVATACMPAAAGAASKPLRASTGWTSPLHHRPTTFATPLFL